MPINGTSSRCNGSTRLLRMQALHAGTSCTDAGQDHPLRTDQPIGIAHQPNAGAEAFERIAHRTKVGTTRVDQRNVTHSAPLVVGNAVPCRANAGRSARANALKQASTL